MAKKNSYTITEAEKARKLQEFNMLNPNDSVTAAKDFQRWEENEETRLWNVQANAKRKRNKVLMIVGAVAVVVGVTIAIVVSRQSNKHQTAEQIATAKSEAAASVSAHDASLAQAESKKQASMAAASSRATAASASSAAKAASSATAASAASAASEKARTTVNISDGAKAQLETYLSKRADLGNMDIDFMSGDDFEYSYYDSDDDEVEAVYAKTVDGKVQLYGDDDSSITKVNDVAIFYPNGKATEKLLNKNKSVTVSYYLFTSDGKVYQDDVELGEPYDGDIQASGMFTFELDDSQPDSSDKVFGLSKDTDVIKYYTALMND